MTDRSAIIAAVAAELDERAGMCLEEHGAIGARVADRLGIVEPAMLCGAHPGAPDMPCARPRGHEGPCGGWLVRS